MLLSAASWYWLTVDCVTRTHQCLDALEQDSEVYQHTNDWLCKLVQDIFQNLRRRRASDYSIAHYIPTPPHIVSSEHISIVAG